MPFTDFVDMLSCGLAESVLFSVGIANKFEEVGFGRIKRARFKR